MPGVVAVQERRSGAHGWGAADAGKLAAMFAPDADFRLADRVSVIRDGRHISTRPVAEVTPQGMIGPK